MNVSGQILAHASIEDESFVTFVGFIQLIQWTTAAKTESQLIQVE